MSQSRQFLLYSQCFPKSFAANRRKVMCTTEDELVNCRNVPFCSVCMKLEAAPNAGTTKMCYDCDKVKHGSDCTNIMKCHHGENVSNLGRVFYYLTMICEKGALCLCKKSIDPGQPAQSSPVKIFLLFEFLNKRFSKIIFWVPQAITWSFSSVKDNKY